ncbi:MAG: 50S ribosomal protein L35 [Candidatus Sericytochromatia bacterium]|nr:50S ribosomal protein L35 [Candidatus Sericytochromatia bacterium]
MPKMKTRKSAAKRFRLTGSGKLVRRCAFGKHLLVNKGSSRKRRVKGSSVVHSSDMARVRAQLPYMGYLK